MDSGLDSELDSELDSGLEDSGLDSELDSELDSGLEDSGLEDSGLEDSGLEDSGLEDSGLEDSGLEDSGLEDSGLEGSGLEGSGLEGSGLEDSGLKDSREDGTVGDHVGVTGSSRFFITTDVDFGSLSSLTLSSAIGTCFDILMENSGASQRTMEEYVEHSLTRRSGRQRVAVRDLNDTTIAVLYGLLSENGSESGRLLGEALLTALKAFFFLPSGFEHPRFLRHTSQEGDQADLGDGTPSRFPESSPAGNVRKLSAPVQAGAFCSAMPNTCAAVQPQ